MPAFADREDGVYGLSRRNLLFDLVEEANEL